MKSILALLAVLPFAAAAFVPVPTAAGAAAPEALRSTAAADLKGDFLKSHKIGDRKGMTKLVRDNAADAVEWMYELADALTREADEERTKLYEAVGRAWADAFSTSLSDHVMGLYKELTGEQRELRRAAHAEYYELSRKYFVKRGEEISPARNTELQQIGEQFDPIGARFDALGDRYFASRCWIYTADAYNAATVGDASANPKRELEAQRKVLDACDRFDVGDRAHRDSKTRVAYLEKAIEAGVAPGGDNPESRDTRPKLPYTFGPAAVSPGAAQELADMKKNPRMLYGWDDDHPTWPVIYLQEVGTVAELPGMVDGPKIERQGLTELVVTDSDGKSRFVQLLNEPVQVKTRAGAGDKAIDYTFSIKVGSQQDTFQGFSANLEPTSGTLALYLRPTASVTVNVDGTDVSVTDDNLDGIFGGPPAETSMNGLSQGVLEPRIDSVFIGRSKMPEPFSEVMRVGKSWYHVVPQDDGRSFEVAPTVDLPVGSVKLLHKGAPLEWIVVRGTDAGEGLFFRLEPGKSVELPAGEYCIYNGEVRDKVSKALLVRGDAKPFEVKAGETTEVTCGAPYRFEFSTSVVPEGVKVKGESVVVVGAGGEHYHRIWGSRPRPEVHLRRPGSGGWSKVGEMDLIDDLDELGEHGSEGWVKVWWPLDVLVENKFGDDVEVRLHEKKNRMFGKIDSAEDQ